MINLVTRECIRAPPRRGRYWEINPRRPKDFSREISRVEGNLEGGGDGFANASGHLSGLWKCTTQYVAPLSSVRNPYYRNMITLQFSSLLAVHHWSGPALTFSLVGYSPPLLLPTPHHQPHTHVITSLGLAPFGFVKQFVFDLKQSTESLLIEILKAE